jgi:hypothetical protein
MKAPQISLPIFSSGQQYDSYPFERLDAPTLAYLHAYDEFDDYKLPCAPAVIRCLECFLQISQEFLNRISNTQVKRIASRFLGFINSNLAPGSEAVVRDRSRCAIRILGSLAAFNGLEYPHLTLDEKSLNKYRTEFFRADLDISKIQYWQGWPVKNKNGRTSFLPLSGFFRAFGPQFCELLYNEAQQYLNGRTQTTIHGLKQLNEFCEINANRFNIEVLRSDVAMSEFWENFVIYFTVELYAEGEGQRLSTIATNWNGEFTNFVTQHLATSGIMSTGFTELPILPKRMSTHGNVKAARNGSGLVHAKLICDIPLQLTDTEALYRIFDQLKTSMASIEQWAQDEILDHDRRWARRKFESAYGVIREINKAGYNQSDGGLIKWQRDRANSNWYANAAKNFEYHNYAFLIKRSAQVFPEPLAQVARELGLVTPGSLQPHCIMLILKHNKITPGFLENLELFDKSGKQIGLIDEESAPKLVGYKFRRGVRFAEIVVNLDNYTVGVVRSIIRITDYARKHLQSIGDNNWRFLLLTGHKSFGTIRRPKLASYSVTMGLLNEHAERLSVISSINNQDAVELLKRSTLTAVRATSAVLVYLETRCAIKMSEALGHARLNHSLLSRYLPGPIWDFFQERWIRLFQAGVVLEAMRGSKNILKASDFNSLEEIENFLNNHALKFKEQPKDPDCDSIQEPQLLISVDYNVFRQLLKLERKSVTSESSLKTQLWADLSKKILSYSRVNLEDRPDLKLALEEATRSLEKTL